MVVVRIRKRGKEKAFTQMEFMYFIVNRKGEGDTHPFWWWGNDVFWVEGFKSAKEAEEHYGFPERYEYVEDVITFLYMGEGVKNLDDALTLEELFRKVGWFAVAGEDFSKEFGLPPRKEARGFVRIFGHGRVEVLSTLVDWRRRGLFVSSPKKVLVVGDKG